MEEANNLIKNLIYEEELIEAIFSNLRSRKDLTYERVSIEPVIIRDEILIQFTYEYKDKVQHENLSYEESLEEIEFLLYDKFRQVNIFSLYKDYQILISKKRKIRISENPPSKKMKSLAHNRKKNYILEEGVAHDFLIHLGIMNKDGRVIKKRYDKFRQINRFLELVSHSIPDLDKGETINIVDFGCGKSYLTFALYYYLVKILDLNVNITGLDLKEDVIKFCNNVALDLDYDGLNFVHGDIRDFKGSDKVDMVVTLHACDIATDAALVKAVDWKAKVILSVPCCQSEFYSKIDNPVLEAMLKHGIVKEKMSSLITDSLRGNVLELLGYDVQLLEFIDMEHTPKNILIRANYKGGNPSREEKQAYYDFKEFWNLKDLFIEDELAKIGISL